MATIPFGTKYGHDVQQYLCLRFLPDSSDRANANYWPNFIRILSPTFQFKIAENNDIYALIYPSFHELHGAASTFIFSDLPKTFTVAYTRYYSTPS